MFQYFLQYHVSFGTVTFDENWKFTKVRIWKLTSFWDQIYTLGFWLSWISTGFSSSFRFCLITVVRNVLSLVIKCGSVWLYLVELNHISNSRNLVVQLKPIYFSISLRLFYVFKVIYSPLTSNNYTTYILL